MRLLIKGGRVISPANNLDHYLDIFIQDRKIKKIAPQIPFPAEETLDAKDKIVIPGLIDLHTHLREPGREDEETLESGTQAAARGGFTSVVAMPNTTPPCDNQSVIKYILNEASGRAVVNIFPTGTLTKERAGEELAPFGELKKAGVVGVTDDGKCVQNAEVMRRALEYSKMFELPVISHCEDENLSQNGVINEGYISTISGLEGIPRLAEEVIIMRDIALAQATGAQLHIAHITTAYSVELVRRAKEQGIKVTAEVTPHHFSLTDESVLELEFNTNTKVNPPLREAKDIEAIKEGLKDGTIDVIATDHAPHTTTEKEVEFALAPFGIIGLETALPLVISELVEKGVLSLSEAIAKLTCEPAKIVNLSKGKIAEGEDADITIISLKKEFVFNRENILSRSSNSPFIGRKFNCSVLTTIVGGKIVMRNEKLTKRRK